MKKKPQNVWNLANAGRPSYENKSTSLYTHANSHIHTCTHVLLSLRKSFFSLLISRSLIFRKTNLPPCCYLNNPGLWLFPLAGILPLVPPAPISPKLNLLLRPNICLDLTLFKNILFWNNFSFTENFQR